MALRIQCPRCQTHLQVADEHRGKQVRCPTCTGVMMVPGPCVTQAIRPVPQAAPPARPAVSSQAVTSRNPAWPAPASPVVSVRRGRPAPAVNLKTRLAGSSQWLRRTVYRACTLREGMPWFLAGAGGALTLFIGFFIALSGSARPFITSIAQAPQGKAAAQPEKKNKPAAPAKKVAGAPVAAGKTEVKTSNYPPNTKEEKAAAATGPKVAEVVPKAVQPPPGPAPADIAADTIRHVKKATAYLRVTLPGGHTGEGSGFFAAEPGLVFTNAHVLGMLGAASPPPSKVDIVVNSGEPDELQLSGQLLGVDRGSDLAILRASGEAMRWPAPLPLDGSQSVTELQKVYVFGFPFGANLGKNITISPSSVSSLRRGNDGGVAQIQVNGGMNPGNSGGPVVDSRGAVVGVSVSIIMGTQINFAVPGEKVQALLHGRVADIHFGEPFQDGAQVKLPLDIECIDPLKRIHGLRAEVWTGKAGNPRPVTDKAPEPSAGDSPRQNVTLQYQDGKGHGEIVLPTVNYGQVVWVQPVLEAGGDYTSWAAATPLPASEFPPVQRAAATLQQRYDAQADRTVKMKADFKMHMGTSPAQVIFGESMDLAAFEQTQTDPRGGKLRLTVSSFTMTREGGGKTVSYLPQVQALLKSRLFTFTSDAGGALLKRNHPTLERFYPLGLRNGYEELAGHIGNAYEMTCFTVPNRLVQPRETWPAKLPLTIMSNGKRELMDLFATCTYEGSRQVQGQNEGLITISGNVKSRQQGATAAGRTFGKVHFNIDKGYISWADLTMDSGGGNDMPFSQTLHVHLTRVPGNAQNITPAPPGPAKAAPGKLQILMQTSTALSGQDPIDFPEKHGCHYKNFPVNLTAGQTYLVEMNVQGKTNLDPYLVLLDPNGKKVAEDDDSGGQLNALLIFKAPVTGTYQIRATTCAEQNEGPFTLRVSMIVRDDAQDDED